MDSRRSELLEKYWAAETSIQEEQELKEIVMQFQEGEDEELKALFSYFKAEVQPELDTSFDDEIVALITEEKEAKVISFNDYFRRHASIAAATLVMAVSGFLFIQQQQQYQSEDTFETPEEAYVAFKQQMLMVSNYMNKGNSVIDGFSSLSNVEKGLNGLATMSSASQGLEMISEMNLENN